MIGEHREWFGRLPLIFSNCKQQKCYIHVPVYLLRLKSVEIGNIFFVVVREKDKPEIEGVQRIIKRFDICFRQRGLFQPGQFRSKVSNQVMKSPLVFIERFCTEREY